MRIAVDIGYGFTKGASEEGKMISFPSVVGRKFISRLGGALSGQEDFEVTLRFQNQDEEQSYFVGDAAMSAGGQRTWEEEAVKNRNLIVLVSTAIALLNTKDEPVDLAVGLPMSYYNTQKNSIKDALENLNLTCIVQDRVCQISVNSVFVFPQSAGVYYSAIHDIDGTIKNANLINKAVGIIDVGYRTADILYIARAKKGLMPRDDLSGSHDLGMNEAHRFIQNEVSKIIKGNADILKIEKSLLWFNGDFEYKGNTISLRKIQDRAYEAHAQAITSWVKQTWGDEIFDLSAIIIGGGGGDSLFPYFKENFETAMKVEKPEFANALGYLAAQALAMNIGKK